MLVSILSLLFARRTTNIAGYITEKLLPVRPVKLYAEAGIGMEDTSNISVQLWDDNMAHFLSRLHSGIRNFECRFDIGYRAREHHNAFAAQSISQANFQ